MVVWSTHIGEPIPHEEETFKSEVSVCVEPCLYGTEPRLRVSASMFNYEFYWEEHMPENDGNNVRIMEKFTYSLAKRLKVLLLPEDPYARH